MFHFPDPADAVRCASVPAARGGQARAATGAGGRARGPVVFRDGDYFGRTVNLASRITDYARPGEVLVSQSVVDTVGEAEGMTFETIGR